MSQRTYTYDLLGCPTTRNTARQGMLTNDNFVHNSRAELMEAQVNGKAYEYSYDNIGNRTAAVEDSSGVASSTVYTANELNQCTAIAENGATAFVPQFDADGNQTLIKTEPGIWSAVYNAENRPVSFTNSESTSVVECAYDSMGRRSYKKVTTDGIVTLHQRYIYRGCLQIACIDLIRSHHPCLWLITWDPSQPVATRPLAIQKDGTWYTYGWDLTKNICEIFNSNGYIATTYSYSPFGKPTFNKTVSQPVMWSSEVWDESLNLTYYNHRYYNPFDGRWTTRDRKSNQADYYVYVSNSPGYRFDFRGDFWPIVARVATVVVKTIARAAVVAGTEYLRQGIMNEIKDSESPWKDDINGGRVAAAGVAGAIGVSPRTLKAGFRIIKAYRGARKIKPRIDRGQKINTNKPLSKHLRRVKRRQDKKNLELEEYNTEINNVIIDEVKRNLVTKAIKDVGEECYDQLNKEIEQDRYWECNTAEINETIDAEVIIESEIIDKTTTPVY